MDVTMSITPKKFEDRYSELVRWQTKLMRGVIEPKSPAQKMYPHLKSKANEDQPQGKFQGWSHLNRSPKEK
jgi:hypothetical protein